MSNKYLLSFTAASLMPYETKEVAIIYFKENNWKRTMDIVVSDNIIQRNSESSRKRIFSELKKRISNLNNKELIFLTESSGNNLKHIVYLSCIKTYKIIFDFAVEVLYNKIIYYDHQILDSDYETFIESKRLEYENLENISSNTNYKIKQVIFRILEQAGLIDSTKTKQITPPMLNEELINLLLNDNPEYLKAFLLSEGDINFYIKKGFEL